MNIHASVPVGVLGASGYVGQELLRLLAGHPRASVAFATAESAAGERRDGVEFVRIEDAPIARAEIVLSALPHGVSARYVQAARGLGKRAVDLSADFRLSPDAVYGLTEVTRPQVAAGRPDRGHPSPSRGGGPRGEPRLLPDRGAARPAPARSGRADRPVPGGGDRRRVGRHGRGPGAPAGPPVR